MPAPTSYQPMTTLEQVFTAEQQQAFSREIKAELCTGKNKKACETVVEAAVNEATMADVPAASIYQAAVNLSAIDEKGANWNYSFSEDSRALTMSRGVVGSTNGPDSGEICTESSATIKANLGVTYGGRTVWKPLVSYTETLALTCQSYADATAEMKRQWEQQKAAEQELQRQLQQK